VPEAVALYVDPDPKFVDVPLAFVPCQYQVIPAAGFPLRVMVTSLHCGELLVKLLGAAMEFTVTGTAILLLAQSS